MCSTKTTTEEEMREEAKVKSERRRFSSAVCKSAIEVGLHRDSPGGFGGACWHFWHWSATDLTEIRHLVDSLSGSYEQTLSKFSLIEYHFVFDRGWRLVCFYKPGDAGLACTDLRSAGSFFPLISDILDLLWTLWHFMQVDTERPSSFHYSSHLLNVLYKKI